jgi:hypothetical protein
LVVDVSNPFQFVSLFGGQPNSHSFYRFHKISISNCHHT